MKEIKIEVDTSGLDAAIEKANRLLELLQEASKIIGSLGNVPKSYEFRFEHDEFLNIADVPVHPRNNSQFSTEH